jgi:hypothetical protein
MLMAIFYQPQFPNQKILAGVEMASNTGNVTEFNQKSCF